MAKPSIRKAPVDAETTATVTIHRPRRAGSIGVRARWCRMSPLWAGSTSGKRLELPPQVRDLVPEAGGHLEAQLPGRLVHLLLQRLDQPGQLLAGHHRRLRLRPAPAPPGAPPATASAA